mmetsp:Transcript_10872/g.30193  ORF Transcript_10872/g.30193 Transcript_10872/m.30193 type:complete len:212 (-) Transcript_10872:282-917(-)
MYGGHLRACDGRALCGLALLGAKSGMGVSVHGQRGRFSGSSALELAHVEGCQRRGGYRGGLGRIVLGPCCLDPLDLPGVGRGHCDHPWCSEAQFGRKSCRNCVVRVYSLRLVQTQTTEFRLQGLQLNSVVGARHARFGQHSVQGRKYGRTQGVDPKVGLVHFNFPCRHLATSLHGRWRVHEGVLFVLGACQHRLGLRDVFYNGCNAAFPVC